MTDRLQSASSVGHHPVAGPHKMDGDLGPRKTMLVLVIVVGCFAVLWPKVFYPMLLGSADQHIKPSSIDKVTGCCDVISETDVNTIKLLSEICGSIIKTTDNEQLNGRQIVQRCRQEVLETCGIDISVILQEQVRLGQNVKQILDEIRSLNGSLCLKYNFGVAPWKLGVPHRITVKPTDALNIRQERPMHLRSELVHPAFRERGRAIPQPQGHAPSRPPPRIVEGRPGPIPGLRPTLGGAGHMVPPPKQGTSSMSIIMPIYTIGIVIFFTYTLMKILFKKQPDTIGGALYPPIDPDPRFRSQVFESEALRAPRLNKDNASRLVVNAMSALLDEVDLEIEQRRNGGVATQDLVNGNLSNGDAVKPQDEEQPTVKVLGMEMTASCEGGKKWTRSESPVLPTSSPIAEPVQPPQEIYLEGALPAQSQLLVSESATKPEETTGENPAVVLSGKMTLSVISPDSENPVEETTNALQENGHIKEETLSTEEFLENLKEDVGAEKRSTPDRDIEELLEKLKEDFQAPSITLENEENTLEVENLEKEVDDLIQEALESVKQKEIEIETNENEAKVDDSKICDNGHAELSNGAKDKEDSLKGADEEDEVVEEIEEIEYEEETEEEEEVEEEEEEEESEELPSGRNTSSIQKVNGEDHVEKSTYATASSATAAENDISDEELEEVEEEEEEIIVVEEDGDEDELEEDHNVNHTAEESE